jgi:MinD superfamily P-loop ATPase
MADLPIIDREKCTGCGLCAGICACGALKMVDQVIQVIEVEECGWCTLCELVCPSGAISCPFEIVIEDNRG